MYKHISLSLYIYIYIWIEREIRTCVAPAAASGPGLCKLLSAVVVVVVLCVVFLRLGFCQANKDTAWFGGPTVSAPFR